MGSAALEAAGSSAKGRGGAPSGPASSCWFERAARSRQAHAPRGGAGAELGRCPWGGGGGGGGNASSVPVHIDIYIYMPVHIDVLFRVDAEEVAPHAEGLRQRVTHYAACSR